MEAQKLGLVVEGSLVDGLKARLQGQTTLEDLRVGKFVKIAGAQHDFFCLITDLQLGATDERVLNDPPDPADDFLRAVLSGTTTYGAMKVQPMLVLPRDGAERLEPEPPRTVPAHFSSVYEADEADFEQVFGSESERFFVMGRPLDMEVDVCLDLERFVQRSNGVFGKSGTGKSFLTRLLICGVVKNQPSLKAVNLIFDMHSEYGHGGRSEDGGIVRGLQDLFGSQRVAVLGLDAGSDSGQARRADRLITIGLNEIEVEDVALLQDELRLNATAVETANLVVDVHGAAWIKALLDMDGAAQKEFVDRSGAHAGALAALKRKLLEIRRLDFVRDHVSGGLDELVAELERGKHIVLEFGQHSRALPYMLVANVITRRIHRRWSQLSEAHRQSQGGQPAPPSLMITIEEAHKFLNQRAAGQTIFGTIAREMRKFQVTLLVVDQRPSGIDDEVLSQIGTRITCQLNDDRDIEAVFSGVSGASHLKSVLATLDSRQQAMILGHATRMPVVIRTRPYDESFYRTLGPAAADPLRAAALRADRARTYQEIFQQEE